MTTLNLTVAMPPNATGGTWTLKPDAPYAVAGSSGVVTSFRGDISSTGVLTAKGGGTAQVVVPASGGYDAGSGVLTTSFVTPTSILPGQPVRVQLVETASGVMDVAYLLNTGRGQVLSPQQLTDFTALVASGTTAAAAANTAATAANTAAAAVAAQQTANNTQQATNNLLLSKVGTTSSATTYPTRNTPAAGTYTSSYETSNFRRFGSTVGVIQDFDRVTVHVRQWDGTRPITSLTLTVRDTSQTGTILATLTKTVSLVTGADTLVAFDLGSVIANASGSQIWMDLDCNGVMGMYDNQGGTAYYQSITNPSWSVLSGSHSLWVQAAKATVLATLALTSEMQGLIGQTPAVVANTAFGGYIGTLKTVLSNVQTTGIPVAQDSNTSTFSGWGSPVGVKAAFDYVAFRINPWSTLPSTPQVRLRIRENDSAGNILYDVTQDVPSLVAAGGVQQLEFYLPTPISTAIPLYIEYFCNFKSGREVVNSTTYSTTAGFGQARYSTTGSVVTTTLGAAGAQFNLYFKFGLQTGTKKLTPLSLFAASIHPNWSASVTVPSNLWAVVGRELNVYYANILNAYTPLNHFWLDVTDSSNKGTEQSERYTLVPTSGQVGTSTLTFDLSFGGQKIASKSSTLTVKAATAGAGITRKVLLIGDSTTEAGVYPTELVNLFTADTAPMRITMLGTRTSTTGGYTATKTEGWSGKTVAYHYADPASNFTFTGTDPNGTTFNFAQYLTANAYTMASGDWVFIHLGINDVFGATDDEAVITTAATMISQMNAMITSIQAAVSGVRIGILEVIPPAAEQDAFGAAYGTNYNRARYRRNRDVLAPLLQAAFEGRTGSNVWYVAFGMALDTVTGMQLGTAAAINSRNSTTVIRQVNSVHPGVSGYNLMADALYAFMKCQET